MENSTIIKIAIIGAESTGKSVLAEQLAKYYNTVFVPEFAREYFMERDIDKHTLSDLDVIYRKQLLLEREREKHASRFLICDTNLISGKVWADIVFKTPPKFIRDNLAGTDHQLHLLCDIDIPWLADSQRRNEYDREQIMKMHLDELNKLGLTYEVIKGTGEERLQNAIKAIRKHFDV